MKSPQRCTKQKQRRHEKHELTITLDSAQGVWERSYLEVDGRVDTTTQVTWIQAGEMHVDLRLACAFRQLPAVPLYQQTPEALLEIASVTAFAGVTHIEHGQCTWTRQINYQGPLLEPDVGVLSWSGDTLVETGMHSAYEEGWLSLTNVPGRARVLGDASGSLVFLCVVAERFGLARANPDAMQQPLSLEDNVRMALDARDEGALIQLFDQEFCIGTITQGYGVISASSMPGRVGTRVFRLLDPIEDVSAMDVLQQDFLGESSVKTYRCISENMLQ